MIKNIYLVAATRTIVIVAILCAVTITFLGISCLWMKMFNISSDAAWFLTCVLGVVGSVFYNSLQDARND
jgi:hypothetical protein